jgi:branched-chain amino acid transport system permease protein
LINYSLWVVYALLTLSLFLVWGHTGMLSLGQTAFFGIAGYAYGVIAINLIGITTESLTALLAAVVMGAGLAALVGYLLFYGRVTEVYLAICTLVVTLVLNTFFGSTANPSYAIGDARLGGYNGMTGIPELTLGIPGVFSFPLSVRGMYVFVVLVTGGVYTFLKVFLRSPFGRILAAVRENELRTELLGYDVRLAKLLAFTLGGAIAGLAGVMYAAWGLFINPAVFSLGQAASVIIWLLVGGRTTMFGAVLGVIVMQRSSSWLGGITQQTPILLGVLLIIIVLLFPDGLVPWLEAAWTSLKKARSGIVGVWLSKLSPQPAHLSSGEKDFIPNPMLRDGDKDRAVVETRDLSVSFGGLMALAGVTLRIDPGLHCLIGPNGAGKTTFFNLLVGRFRPTMGLILFNGKDVTRLKIHQRARLGIGIKTQVPSIYDKLSVEENVWLGAYALLRDRRRATLRAREVLQQVGIRIDRFGELAVNLSHGEQQLLEAAIVLASSPKLILLDEPSAGMTREEARRMVHLLCELAGSATVVVVEHNMEFVRQLQAPVTVLHQGMVFAQGSLEQLRQDQGVINIYLGRRAHATG